MCDPCPVGKRVFSHCNGTKPTICSDCPDGTFSDIKNHKMECQRCQRCRRKELIKKKCSKTSNTICECRPGYIYRPTKPCFKCPQGFVAKDNKCVNETTPKNEDNPVQSKGSPMLIIGLSIGIVVVIITLIVIFYIIYKRRGRRIPHLGGEMPDVLKNIKTPPLPPKTLNRRTENNYGPAPQVCRPLVEKKLISRHLPFSLVHDMNEMLSTNHPKNYKHLAGKLGYSYAFVKSLSTKQQPLETLMDNYMSGENPTKEKLVEALLAIDREDVARMVMEEL